MPIASRACSPRIGTRRLRPHAPRAAQSHALCKPAGTAAGHGAAAGQLFESPSPPHRSTIRSGGHPGILGEQLGGRGGHTAATRGSKAAAAAIAAVRARRPFSSERGASAARTARAAGVEHASSSDGTQGTRGARFGGVPRVSWSLECVLVCMYSGAPVLGLDCSVTSSIGPVLESHFCLLGILLHDDFETF